MKKLISILLCAVIMLLFTACGGDKPNPDSDAPVVSAPEDTTAFFNKITYDTLDINKFNYDRNYNMWTLKYEETKEYDFDFKIKIDGAEYQLTNMSLEDLAENGWSIQNEDEEIDSGKTLGITATKGEEDLAVTLKANGKEATTPLFECDIMALSVNKTGKTLVEIGKVNSNSKFKDFIDYFGYPTYISPDEKGEWVTVKFEGKKDHNQVLSIEYDITNDRLASLQYRSGI